MNYRSTKFIPFKKLLELKNSNRLYMFNWYESWILGCYNNYTDKLSNITSSKDEKIINKWWKGCLKKYYNEKYVN